MLNNDRPTLGQLTDVGSVIAALDEYERLGARAFFDKYSYVDNLGKPHRFSKSTKYPLYYRNAKDPTVPFPSKAIVAAAHWHQHRGELLAFFSGGLKTVVAKLESLDTDHAYFWVAHPDLDSIPDTHISLSNNFERLLTFIQDEMLMHAVYQPVMLRVLLQNGPTGVPTIARAIWTEDSGRRGGPSTYEGIVTNLPGPVLYGHGLVSYDDASDEYSLELDSDFTREQLRILLQTCDDKITEYLGRNEAPAERGDDSRPDGESRWLRQGGQGYHGDPEEQRAVETRAVQIATDYYERKGYEVEDVGARCSYDLRCTKGLADLHVEVKGTRGHGTSVILTKNEVSHARVYRPVSLFIVTGIKTERTPEGMKAHGGMNHVLDPWDIDAGELVPDRFTYQPNVK